MTQPPLFELPDQTVGSVETALRKRGIETVVGVDEAGRGPLAGPVVAAAYVLELDASLPDALEGLDDSKKLDVEQREQLYETLAKRPERYAVADEDAGVIDEINVLQATFRAMRRAVEEVVDRCDDPPDIVLVDGHMTIPDGSWRQQAVVKGDGRSTAIAAASILAKVERDRWMCEADGRWPEYGFASHKGYGTAQHREAIREHGPCRLHRRSFAGVESTSESRD